MPKDTTGGGVFVGLEVDAVIGELAPVEDAAELDAAEVADAEPELGLADVVVLELPVVEEEAPEADAELERELGGTVDTIVNCD